MLSTKTREQIKNEILNGLGDGEQFVEETDTEIIVSVYARGVFCEFRLSQELGEWEVHGCVKPWKSQVTVSELSRVAALFTELSVTMKEVQERIYGALLAQDDVRVSSPSLPPVALS